MIINKKVKDIWEVTHIQVDPPSGDHYWSGVIFYTRKNGKDNYMCFFLDSCNRCGIEERIKYGNAEALPKPTHIAENETVYKGSARDYWISLNFEESDRTKVHPFFDYENLRLIKEGDPDKRYQFERKGKMVWNDSFSLCFEK
jgi:hypothetical protein